jgi:sortase (surface protein transpeptidase)
MTSTTNKRRLGNLFMAVGLLLVLGAGVSFGWEQIQSALLQARLRNLPPARPVVAQIANQTGQPILPAPPTETSTTVPPGALATTQSLAATTELSATSPLAEPTALPVEPTVAPATAEPRLPTTTPSPTPMPPTSTPMPPSQPVRMVIPDLGIDIAVTEMTWKDVKTAHSVQSEWEIPEYAAGHAVNSAQLGETGNVVISGHNNIYGRVFMAISEAWGGTMQVVDKVTERTRLLDGRLVQMYAADGRRFDYIITDFLRVQDSGVPLAQRIANAQYIAQTSDSRLTITTCWPPWSNTHRLVVIAQPAN